MAHRILGIELGSYSVKVAVATSGLRKTAIVDLFERVIPPGDEPAEERAAKVVGELAREQGFAHDLPYYLLGGESVSVRVLDFPFSGLKRSDLEKTVGAELEAQLPHDLDAMTYDFDVLPREAPVVAGAADPAFVEAGKPAAPGKTAAPATQGTRILAAATTRERVARLLALTSAQGVEARAVVAAPAAYAKVASLLGPPGPEAGAILVIDHGHTRTDLAVVHRGKTVFARTIWRGGRHITQAIARTWNLSFEDAERAKHSDGFVESSQEPAASEAWQRISQVVKQELAPLVRDLRQSLAACAAEVGVPLSRAVLCGGGARLRGLGAWLQDETGVPVATVTAADAARLLSPQLAGRAANVDAAIAAIGLALEAGAGRVPFDLRKGDLAYKADYSFLRQRAGVLATAALVLVAFAAANAYAALYKLGKERDILEKRLEQATTEVFGEIVPLEDLEGKISPVVEKSPLPKNTAWDQLVAISNHLPARTEAKVDVLEIEIEAKKISMKAITESSAAADLVEKKLKEVECFTNVQQGKSDTVTEGQQVPFTITTKCM